MLRQASQRGEGSVLHMSENGQCVLIMEMLGGRLQMMSGTLERLFMKLADESAQDFDYVDTYIHSHLFFTTSTEFLENLMARFHLEALPGDYDYFRKWQRCIQVKVLNVISRWIKLQFQDFESNRILITRLEAFLNGDVNRAGFRIESDMMKEALDRQLKKMKTSRHDQIIQASKSLVSFGSATTPHTLKRRPSVTPSFLSFSSSYNNNTPPDSPTYPIAPHTHCNDLLSMDTKDMARYLTLADFMLLKCITVYDYLTVQFQKKRGGDGCTQEYNYIDMMTERANRLSKWVVYEITSQKVAKYRRNTIRKMIELAKHCLNWNNYHTSMIITIGINQIPEIQDTSNLESILPSKEYQTFKHLLKYLDVCNNMQYYRTAFKKNTKTPCVPFFPLILKDFTFLVDGNPTFLLQQQDNNTKSVNFSKFRSMIQLTHTVLNYTAENYYFAADLEYFPFFPLSSSSSLEKSAGPLDQVADMIESRIRNCT
ncbi:ras GEF [Backusella circina FSU 941]|nr:ras GEF [Backusella circina FSU 941]